MNKYAISLILLSSLLLYCCKPEISKKKINHETTNELVENKKIIPKTPEKKLREKLNNTEKTNLDFLKQALNDNDKFNRFILSNESKIKSALEHIKTQTENCNGNNAEDQKRTFKELIKAYFGQMNDSELDQFKTNVLSSCNGAGG
ncbi:Mlp family lipoprotein (plasmid) [Borrelia parkeri]|uniref:Mlp family lipoprotein n=1 Tax=Borrelia parkeri TaxID=141 RepID=UPI001FF0FBD1|nr:Mlp family lipoprotein [Borrelia parkeri]UPA11499.1 Mlp family lipoprotein [Borrelia parkeri]